MQTRLATLLFIGSLAGVCFADEQKVDYVTQVKPIFTHHCTTCHGAIKQKSGLRLDAGSLIHKGGESGPAIVPHRPDESLLIHSVTGKADVEKMPMEGTPLTEQQVALLRRWIEQGAPFPKEEKTPTDPSKHWAFQPVVKPPVPNVKNEAWAKHPIDAFLAAEHQARGLTPVGHAEPHVLVRRLYLDLTGLPPTPSEVEAFVKLAGSASATAETAADADAASAKTVGDAHPASDAAYEKLVDQLLATPRHAERWARHWMDIWRYSDWYGYGNELRNSQKHMWRYRDWIIESLRDDKSYDRMIIEMLAADEAFATDADALRAMGFLSRNYYKFNRHVWLDSIVEHTSKGFLGVTVNCARCHDHMYDPILQTEYYQLRAVFEPHQVRLDRLPGQSDVEKNGLSRVYDADTAAQTFLFERGNDMMPVKDKPLPPGVPKALIATAGALKVETVALEAQAYYPGLRAFVQEEELAAAKAAVATWDAALAKARAGGDALALIAATKHAAAAHTRAAALAAAIESDKAKYADPPAANAGELAKTAAAASRAHALLSAEAALADVEYQLAAAEAALAAADDEKKKAAKTKAVEETKKKVDAAKKQVDAVAKEAAKKDENYPALSPTYPATSTGRRLALAKWIASKKNPLTARVAVNHIWMRHFGRPLVTTVFDFGLNGREPTHPQLLDYLAAEFMESGWSMRHLHRLIVTSNAYRMASAEAPARDSSATASTTSAAIDPDNRYLWRFPARRLEAEAIRDSLIFIAGKLDAATGGPELDHNAGMTTYRRSLYYRHALEKQMTFLTIFDVASPVECYKRAETIVPQQALALANSPLALDMSRVLAAELTKNITAPSAADAPDDAGDRAFIDAAFLRILSRPASDAERNECLAFLTEQSKSLAAPENQQPFTGGGKPTIKPAASPHQRAREDLVHVLINHHEFVTIR